MVALAAAPWLLAAASVPEIRRWTEATPALALPALSGKAVDLRELRGRVVLVNFWATWCEPCREEMPSLAGLRERFAGQPLEVLFVNYGESPERVRRYLEREKLAIEVLMDRGQEAAGRWKAKGLPMTFLVDARGQVRYWAFGERDWAFGEARAKIEELLAEADLGAAEHAIRVVRRMPEGDLAAELEEVVRGLLERPARIAPKYFYDELGCALYGAICELPEYYPTRTERAIFEEHREAIAAAVGPVGQFVDIGAGDCGKAESWLAFLACRRYVAVDIAEPQIRRALTRLATDFPAIDMVGLVTDFSRELVLGDEVTADPTLFFYPGSSIGNFTPPEAVRFLASIRQACARRPGSSLLIGVDAKKDARTLDAAYDDPLGVTAAFNRNALLHLNRRFGFDFPLDGFDHVGFYNEGEGRVEMHLEARHAIEVSLGGQARRFEKGERIHTENSYKYRPAEFEALLRSAGFESMRAWHAPGEAFFVYHAA